MANFRLARIVLTNRSINLLQVYNCFIELSRCFPFVCQISCPINDKRVSEEEGGKVDFLSFCDQITSSVMTREARRSSIEANLFEETRHIKVA